MFVDRIEGKWIELFAEVFGLCRMNPRGACAVGRESPTDELDDKLVVSNERLQ